ncbi:MAG: sulfurtransferase-like selenium metabolism protein YedF [Candidatus Cloacimonetes bacterium]|nr:sulfurtransferase-like selenium metabolism protein YedF [Candidatus Cloacimonadota bacterium]
MKKVIDARKMDCPKPVLLTKKALEAGGFSQLEILVDNKAARDNVISFLEKKESPASRIIDNDGDFTIYLDNVKPLPGNPQTDIEQLHPLSGKTVFISSESIGDGSEELGKKLMKAFTFSLNELQVKPQCLLFMNAGVKLCIEKADTLANLKKLAEYGTEILVCGTCLDYFGISNKLAVGKISNMYDIATHLLTDKGVIKI